MTAMSDVTVLLLTFFMLTSTFVKKEPVEVFTPASVSEIKIPETNILQILVDPAGKIFMSLDKQPDMKAVLKNEGIPCDSTDNQFKSWVRNARAVNSDLRIAIKADANTPYAVIKKVMNSLQDLRENRYNLITLRNIIWLPP